MLIINLGTGQQKDTTEENAMKSVKQFSRDLNLDGLKLKRLKARDDLNGWYGFKLIYQDRELEINIPGVEPNIFLKGKPFESPRCYVNGNSWLYGFGLSSAKEFLTNPNNKENDNDND